MEEGDRINSSAEEETWSSNSERGSSVAPVGHIGPMRSELTRLCWRRWREKSEWSDGCVSVCVCTGREVDVGRCQGERRETWRRWRRESQSVQSVAAIV